MKTMISVCFTVILAIPALAEDVGSEEYVSTAEMTEPLEAPSAAEDRDTSRIRAFPLVKYDRDGDKERQKVLYVPGASVVKSRSDADESKVAVLDVPFFTLAESEHRENGEFDNKAIDIPIFGPLFRHRREGNKEKVRFLFFSHTRTVDPDEYGQPRERKEYRPRGGGKAGGIRNSR